MNGRVCAKSCADHEDIDSDDELFNLDLQNSVSVSDICVMSHFSRFQLFSTLLIVLIVPLRSNRIKNNFA
jgi:hypothetical protein